MAEKSLQFLDLSRRHAGVSHGISISYSEAIRVCLDRHHSSPVSIMITDAALSQTASAEWPRADDRTANAWANRDDATEWGAYGLSLAAIEITRGLVAVKRAETRTGADYYLAAPDADLEDLEGAYRLEVSGTDDGNEAVIQNRLRRKLEQAQKGNSNLPAIATVVGFSALRIVSADLIEDT